VVRNKEGAGRINLEVTDLWMWLGCSDIHATCSVFLCDGNLY
jgi:hypothetical protein